MNRIYSNKALPIFLMVLLACSSVALQSARGMSQEGLARLKGEVKDSENKPLEGVKIQINNLDTGRKYESKTKKKGKFLISFIEPGRYSFTTEKEGYMAQTGEIFLQPNAVQDIEIVLTKAATEEEIAQREAISLFQEAVELNSENKVDEAISKFREATERKPDFYEAYMNLGLLLYRQKKDDEAEKALLRAYELKPDDPKALPLLAEIYYEKARNLVQLKKEEAALEFLEKAYSFYPEHAYTNYLLGMLYAQKDKKIEAVKHLEAFLKLEPDSPVADKAKEILEQLK
ncbi:MAG: tetratricopeptide repeat protein [Candidatus Aminicenantes bacterium]|nr:tetratricopeptide repeat protein [Candidatus Aminicenantes bacterium]